MMGAEAKVEVNGRGIGSTGSKETTSFTIPEPVFMYPLIK